jgi:3',5'-cyclic AMP phosphodiesterase CpdA
MGDSRSNHDLWVNITKHINQLHPKPEFVINTGDIVPRGYTSEYLEYYIPPLLETDIPFFVAIGNHDDGDNATAFEYQTLFGNNSLNYYFDYSNRRFVFVDNVTSVTPYEKTLAWLRRVLKETPEDHKIVVSAHKPIATMLKWAYHSWDLKNSLVFMNLMSEYNAEHVFFGHIHAYSTAELEGIDYTISGGGGAGLHDRFGPLGNVHHYIICDVGADGSIEQKVARFYKAEEETPGM